jgi:hypothetical protein
LRRNGRTGRLIVRESLAKGRSVVVLVRLKARALDLAGQSIAVPPDQQALRTGLADRPNLSFGKWSAVFGDSAVDN